MTTVTRHAKNLEIDFERPLSPAFEKAVEALADIHLDKLSIEDVQIISEYARNMAGIKAYRLVHPNGTAKESRAFFSRQEVKVAVQQLKKQHLIYTEVGYSQKMTMLWNIAEFCSGTMFDAEGNEIMKNPGAAKACIGEMNKMQGDIAPEKKEIVIKQAELTEDELMEKIAGLTKILDMEIEDAVIVDEPEVLDGHVSESERSEKLESLSGDTQQINENA